jgi:hypothetical protein
MAIVSDGHPIASPTVDGNPCSDLGAAVKTMQAEQGECNAALFANVASTPLPGSLLERLWWFRDGRSSMMIF